MHFFLRIKHLSAFEPCFCAAVLNLKHYFFPIISCNVKVNTNSQAVQLTLYSVYTGTEPDTLYCQEVRTKWVSDNHTEYENLRPVALPLTAEVMFFLC